MVRRRKRWQNLVSSDCSQMMSEGSFASRNCILCLSKRSIFLFFTTVWAASLCWKVTKTLVGVVIRSRFLSLYLSILSSTSLAFPNSAFYKYYPLSPNILITYLFLKLNRIALISAPFKQSSYLIDFCSGYGTRSYKRSATFRSSWSLICFSRRVMRGSDCWEWFVLKVE